MKEQVQLVLCQCGKFLTLDECTGNGAKCSTCYQNLENLSKLRGDFKKKGCKLLTKKIACPDKSKKLKNTIVLIELPCRHLACVSYDGYLNSPYCLKCEKKHEASRKQPNIVFTESHSKNLLSQNKPIPKRLRSKLAFRDQINKNQYEESDTTNLISNESYFEKLWIETISYKKLNII